MQKNRVLQGMLQKEDCSYLTCWLKISQHHLVSKESVILQHLNYV